MLIRSFAADIAVVACENVGLIDLLLRIAKVELVRRTSSSVVGATDVKGSLTPKLENRLYLFSRSASPL